jgi:hypothetical protein
LPLPALPSSPLLEPHALAQISAAQVATPAKRNPTNSRMRKRNHTVPTQRKARDCPPTAITPRIRAALARVKGAANFNDQPISARRSPR